MKKNKIILISLFVLLLIATAFFYYNASVGFGKASVKTIEAVQEIKSDLKKKNINIVDSIKVKLDSINMVNKDSLNGHRPN